MGGSLAPLYACRHVGEAELRGGARDQLAESDALRTTAQLQAARPVERCGDADASPRGPTVIVFSAFAPINWPAAADSNTI
jgi:hypothetical protein